jgi:hypothetical protein
MLKKPGVKTKEGLQISGIYGLVLALLGNTFFPDVSTEDVFNTVEQVSEWHKNADGLGISEMINKFLNLTVVTYLLNRLRNKVK